MIRTIEVTIDDKGIAHPTKPGTVLPQGRALLTWRVSEDALGLILSEKSLAVDWLRPEGDEAWAYLQPAAMAPKQ